MSRLTQLFVFPVGYSAQDQLTAIRQSAGSEVRALFGTPDLLLVNMADDQTVFEPLKIEQVRHLHLELLQSPVQHHFRIILLGNIEKASLPAQQALLKILEEPPEHIQMIVTTTQEHAVLPTILSRCQRLQLSLMDQPQQTHMQLLQLESILAEYPHKVLPFHQIFSLSEQYKDRQLAEEFLHRVLEMAHSSPTYPSAHLVTFCQACSQGIQQLQANTNTRLVLEQVLFILSAKY